jgi:hypothetical protein
MTASDPVRLLDITSMAHLPIIATTGVLGARMRRVSALGTAPLSRHFLES